MMAALDPSPVTSGHDVTSTPGHDKLNVTTEQKQIEKRTLSEKERQDQAAHTIQRYYRGYRTRRELKGWSLSSATRWVEAVKEAQWQQTMQNQYSAETNNDVPHNSNKDNVIQHEEDEDAKSGEGDQNKSRRSSQSGLSPEVRRKWKLAGQIALRAGGDDNIHDKIVEEHVSKTEERNQSMPGAGSASVSGSKSVHTFQHSMSTGKGRRRSSVTTNTTADTEKTAKIMDLQYFLEMVDQKHRYGSNLRAYHTVWKNGPSKQNFFYWLDYGEGKDFELERVPRDRLEREQVRYLSREERQDYLVVVDEEGRFRWAKNGERVWTDGERFKDSIRGVVPVDDKTPSFRQYTAEGEMVVDSSDDDDSDDEEEEEDSDEEVQRYVNPDFDDAKGIKKVEYVSPAVIFNHLMQKSLKKKDKWIFVADTSFRIYVGIKASGAFQHSSFLRGARIAAAGLIKIKNGQIRSLSPLSGHYRPPAANFRAFVHALKNNGVDMSHISISRSYAVLVGIEGYMKFKQKKKDVKDKIAEEKAKVANKKSEKDENDGENGTNAVPDVSRTRPTEKKTTTAAVDQTSTTTTTTMTTQETQQVNGDADGTQKKTGFFSKIAKTITRRGSTQESKTVEIRGRGVPGTGPEEGVPPAEGNR